MSSLSEQFKGLTKKVPDFPGAIRGKKNLVPGRQYVTKCVFPDDGHHKPCEDEIFTFEADIDGVFFRGESTIPNSSGHSYADRGIEPYRGSGGAWHKVHYTLCR